MDLQLDNMNRLQLRSLCRAAKVKGFAKMTKEQMQKALVKVKGIPLGNLVQDGEAFFAAFPDEPEMVDAHEAEFKAEMEATGDIAPVAPVVMTAAEERAENVKAYNEGKAQRKGPPKPTREIRNGVKRPIKGKCADVWNELDKLVAKGETDLTTAIHAIGEKRGWNKTNTGLELSAYRRYFGISPRKEVTSKKAA